MNTALLEQENRVVQIESAQRAAALEAVQRTVSLEVTYSETDYYFLAPSQTETGDYEVKLWLSK